MEILYRDTHLVAVHKPAGLLVHRSDIDRHETRFAVQLLRDQIGQHVWPAHRLDRGTSGVLLFALDARTAAQLGRQFEAQTVGKRYLAVVRGYPPETGLIDHPLSRRHDAKHWRDPRAEAAAPQPARTRYRCLATIELPIAVDRYPTSRYALVELEPETGRRHQIRRHLKHIAHPIIGDATYGKGRHNRMFAQSFGCTRLLLACTRLSFAHPLGGHPLTIEAPPAADFLALMARFGWTVPAEG
ncbi:pseudouridylate synthase [Nitrogeniibacter mangrovi]|uniref:tRNA pseudouridine synthase C n=1 Tax=Nitrogeniibacter mangrovi TaxID=2016596 RepID=A0A6C1B7T5_9RHOO|nr:pseudouridylate synthase [Nitrogeniibacter mangrovi]